MLGGLHVYGANVSEFERNMVTYVQDHELIVFGHGIRTLSLPDQLTVEKNLELICVSDIKIKINCPQSGKSLFHIKLKLTTIVKLKFN